MDKGHMTNLQTFLLAITVSTALVALTIGGAWFCCWMAVRKPKQIGRGELKRKLVESGVFRFATSEEINDPTVPKFWI